MKRDLKNNPYLANRPPVPKKFLSRFRWPAGPRVGPEAQGPQEFSRRMKRWAVLLLLCGFWFYLEWTVNAKVTAELRDGPRSKMVKDSALWGWADYDQERGHVSFRLGNTSPAEIDFTGAEYFILLKNGRKYELDVRKMNGVYHSQEVEAARLPPLSGDFGLLVRCALPLELLATEAGAPVGEKVKGYRIIFRDKKEVQFGYKDMNYLQRIGKFATIAWGKLKKFLPY